MRGGTGRRIHEPGAREDVDRELRFHLEMRTQELIEAGWDATAARLEARRVFGDVEDIRRECEELTSRHRRSTQRMTMLSELLQDLRYGMRGLIREPAFSLLAVLTLALGIGANSAAFAIVNGVLLSPLPYPDPDRLVAVWEESEQGQQMRVAWPNYQDWRRSELSTVAGIAAYIRPQTKAVLGGREPVRANVAYVAGDLFDVMGVAPVLGRTFVAEELVPNGRPAVIVSHSFWQQHLGGERDLTRLVLEIDRGSAPVVGVMPRGFRYPDGAQIWYPADLSASWGARTAHNFNATARLAPGASIEAARAQLSSLAREIREREPESNAAAVALRPLHEESVADARLALLILLGASGFVLLVACTNLASALLARAARRRRELAVRAALGAHRIRLIRQLLTESLLLAAFGAVAGLVLAHLLIDALRVIGPHAVPRLEEVRLDGWVLGFTTLLVVATALTFGVVPALRATTAQPFDALRESGQGTGSPGQRRAWSALIGAEVALALLLAIGSGLLIRSFWNVVRVDPGFEVEGSLAVSLDLPASKYPHGEDRVRFYDQLLGEVRALAGVRGAAVTMTLPLVDFDPHGRFLIEGGDAEGGNAHYRVVSPGFFEAMRIPVRRGRAFTNADRAGALDVIVINETLAQRYFGRDDPIGRRIMTGGMDSRFGDYATVIGIVGDVRQSSLTAPPSPGYYLPYMQRPDRIGSASLVVRGTQRPELLAQPVRATVRSIDSDVVMEVSTLQARLSESVADRRFTMLLLGGFALIALLLAAVGIYGVVAYAVARQTREIGIRLALGAEKRRVLWLVGRSTMLSAAVGVAVGLLGGLLLARITASLLYELDAIDPLTFVAVAMLLLATAWLAVLVPGLRAMRVSPMTALRSD